MRKDWRACACMTPRKARDLLVEAAHVEPANAMVHSALAQAWKALGYDERAKQEAKQALDLSAGLSRERRLLIEARYRETIGERDRAVEIYGALFRFFPDNLDYGLRLSIAQTAAGKGQDALSTLATLRKLPPPTRDDPRIDLQESMAAESLGDFHKTEQLAAAAVEKGERQGASLLAARARFQRGWALERLGQLQQATAVLSQAEHEFTRAGDNLRRGPDVTCDRGITLRSRRSAGSAQISRRQSAGFPQDRRPARCGQFSELHRQHSLRTGKSGGGQESV